MPYQIWECLVCGWQYDESLGLPDEGIAPGTRWADVPEDWLCPDCGVGKADFEMVAVAVAEAVQAAAPATAVPAPATPAPAVAANAVGDDSALQIWECLVCGWQYDESKGLPEEGFVPGTRWADIPDDWLCPDCGVGKADFEMVAVAAAPVPAAAQQVPPQAEQHAAPAAPAIDSSLAPIVIVGSGLAGYTLLKELRQAGSVAPVVVITADDGGFYSKPMLSAALGQGKQPGQLMTASAAEMAAKFSAQLKIYTRVTAIDAQAKTVSCDDGDSFHYSELVLATGARCIEPPLQGSGSGRVYAVNNLQDYLRFRTSLTGVRKVLVVGGGLIGCEYANDLTKAGYQVELVEAAPRLLANLLPAEGSAALLSAMQAAGVQCHFDTVAERIDQHGSGVVAQLGNGSRVEADIVLSAVGVRPDLSLAQAAGLATERGIVTNRSLQTSAEHIYALGDCAEVDGQLLFYIAPLNDAAKALAATLCGRPAQVCYGVMPVVIKTPLCPISLVVPPRDIDGSWVVEGSGENIAARYLDASGVQWGFALTGTATSQRAACAAANQPLMR
ncbi:rubredoxin--NAD(+) reductase [Gammaproteobacteria bacterium LSUCC0057]|uniref:Rubredoxin--NAD(+) reductase n=1 Tax=Gammaproteobacteria bacterium LSUCC0057 TaxID=2559237 RepID=A0A4Y8ULT3_9GAMM|nr:rubredoxin--NAD(+) reductase [Gammaproteobacteria bacterium LSUCC0057]